MTGITEYEVVWAIKIAAVDPEDAARQALAIHRDPESTATVFGVTDHKRDKHWIVDLDETREED